jgi:hypothetical protein
MSFVGFTTLRILPDIFFGKHINLPSIMFSIDAPRNPAIIELIDAFPIEVSSNYARFDVTYTTLIVFGSTSKKSLYTFTLSSSESK